jgi:hypothetical protein
MIPKPLEAIAEDDLTALVAQGRREDRSIEYKQDWPAPADRDRVPLVETVASFANEIGGDLLIGVREEQGLPVEIIGVEAQDPDGMRVQLDQAIRSHTDPSCNSHVVLPLRLRNGRYVFLVRVAESWAKPHRITKNNKFVGRGSSGKYIMDTMQIRGAFVRLLEIPDRARKLREDRFEAARSGRLPEPIRPGIVFSLQLVPFKSMVNPPLLSSEVLYSARDEFRPMRADGLSTRHYSDGIFLFGGHRPVQSVVQALRNGIVDCTTTFSNRDEQNRLLFPITMYERLTIEFLPRYLIGLQRLGLSGPYYVFLSFFFPGGTYVPMNYPIHEQLAIDREVVLIPEVELAGIETNITERLKAAFDVVWNAWGEPRSVNYDANGVWAPRVR